MKEIKFALLPFTLLSAGYLISFMGSPFLLIMFVPLAFLLLFFTTIAHFTKMPPAFKVISIFILGGILGWGINRYSFPHRFHPISLIGNGVLFFFMLFSCWCSIKPRRKKIIRIGGALFIVIITLLMLSSLIQISRPNETEAIDSLQSLPYLSYVADTEGQHNDGVLIQTPKSWNGLNLYCSFLSPGAHLMDMKGNILHTWLPKNSPSDWFYVTLYNKGELLVSVRDETLMLLDWDSQVKWKRQFRSHHDIAVTKDGMIYALSRKDEILFKFGIPIPVLNDYLVILTPEGTTKEEISLGRILLSKLSAERIPEMYAWSFNPFNLWKLFRQKTQSPFILRHDTTFDIFHNNTLTLLEQAIPGIAKEGDILIAARELNLIGIIDPDQETLVWSWGEHELDRPHHPTLLPNGNILIFDNGSLRDYSRIIELDPKNKKIVWKYEASPPQSFYSSYAGSAQHLKNGNTLITDSANGRVFEVTEEHETVWEFYNPDKDVNGRRKTIYRMMRITDADILAEVKKRLDF